MLLPSSLLLSALLFFTSLDVDAKLHKRNVPLATETWVKRDVAAAEAPVTFSLALTGENFHELEARMMSISKERGNWLKRDELAYYTRPSELAKRHVEEFLASGGVARDEIAYSAHEDVVTVRSNVGTVARLFNTRMHDYEHAPSGEIFTRALHYELPDHLDEHVLHVRGVSDFVKAEPRRGAGAFEGGNKLPQMKKVVSSSTHKTTSTKKATSTSSKKSTSTSSKKSTPIKQATSSVKTTSSTKKATSTTKPATSSTKKTTSSSTKKTSVCTNKAAVCTSSAKTTSTTTKKATSTSTKKASTTSKTTSTLKTYYASDLSYPTGLSSPHEYPAGCIDTNASFACITRMYGTDVYTPTKDIESLAVVNYGAWQNESVLSFNSLHQPKAPAGYIPNQAYLGDPDGLWDANITVDDGEAILDIECAIGVAYGLNITAYQSSVDYTGTVEALINLPDADRPGVVSMSYGLQENDVDKSYAVDFCQQAQILTALGTTFVVATGDNGVSINNSTTCPPFASDMMSSCPYVVGVGGTANFNPERAGYEPSLPELYNGWSSGGFSRYFDTPSYQNASVTNYLAVTNNSWSEYYNGKGRGFPDVAAYGQSINTVQKTVDGVYMYLAGGTSASSPIFASVLALVNAKCAEAGKGRVGWMQPTMYAAADAGNTALNDITKGGSYWCGDYERAPGFSCEAGWDPATGLGTPYFQKLVDIFGCS